MKFHIFDKLPPYVFNVINNMKIEARRRGEDIIDLGMGNPDLPTPQPIVDKLIEAAQNPRNHRYSSSRGIFKLREALADWYARNFAVSLDPEREVIATIGVKEGLGHLVQALLDRGEKALVPDPCYPIHAYSVLMAGGNLVRVPLGEPRDFLQRVRRRLSGNGVKIVLFSFPHNPTTRCVDPEFFEEMVHLARSHGALIVHDFAYADLVFDGYRAPSILQVPGAREVCVEFFSLSKSYSMPGWRVGFCAGNAQIVAALARLKSYMDYGIFQPIQIASIIALRECGAGVSTIVETYRRRRDVLVEGLQRAGWPVEKPRGSMFVWAPIPEAFGSLGSLKFCQWLLESSRVAASPGIGFGPAGEGFVRFALVENEQRIRQAVSGIRRALRAQQPLAG
ncbi:MAG: aminotransferase class I/II-fold pyridoxal phosphate-dependent enzyme [Acidobacteria bacterium]|nr:aminotransferase class I/II-fold pyridoxal phosphate-dependent enzyme [Acidobacteriota bacterium]